VIVPEIAKVLTVLERDFPALVANKEDFAKNVMGVMEARGITQDPKKMLDTLDNLARAITLSQGKMGVQDYETLMRRGGPGNAVAKDNESILWDYAAAAQFKVAGGGGGGGAGGVSTFATMQKQSEKRAAGGVAETQNAVDLLTEFGVIDKSQLHKANGVGDDDSLPSHFKTVAYAGSEHAAENMTKFAMDMVNEVKKKLAASNPNDFRFFAPGDDRKSDAAQSRAFNKYAQSAFSNTSESQYYSTFASQGTQDRIGKEVQASKDAPSYGKDQEEIMKSWGMAVQTTNAQLEKLGVVVGNILIPVLKPMMEVVTSVVTTLREFGENDPTAAKLAVIATAGLAVNMAFQGFKSVFGVVGNLSSVLSSASNSAKGMEVSTSGLATSTASARKEMVANLATAESSALAHRELAQIQLAEAQATVSNAKGYGQWTSAVNQLIPAQANATAKTIAHTTAQTALQNAQKASTLGARALNGALSLFGGPIGLIITGLTVAIGLWDAFGDHAATAAEKAKEKTGEVVAEVDQAIKRMQEELQVASGGENAVARNKISDSISSDKTSLEQAKRDAAAAEQNFADTSKHAGGDSGEVAIAASASAASKAEAAVKSLEDGIKLKEQKLNDLNEQENKNILARAANTAKAAEQAQKLLSDATKAGAAKADATKGGATPADPGAFTPPKSNFSPVSKERAPAEDPLTAALATAAAKVDEQQIKLESIISGGEKLSDLNAEAAAVIEGNRKAGQYDTTSRDSKGKETRSTPGADSSRIADLKAQTAANMLLAEQIKAVTFANERVAAAQDETDFAMDRLDDGNLSKQTDAFRALTRELDRAEERLGAGAKAFEAWGQKKDKALLGQALADGANQAANDKQSQKTDTSGMSHNEAITSEQGDANKKINDVLDSREDAIKDSLANSINDIKANLDAQLELYKGNDLARQVLEMQAADQIEQVNRQANVVIEALDADRTAKAKQQAAELKKALETPMDGLAKQWADTQQQLQGLQDQWANGFITLLETTMHKGESRLKQFKQTVSSYMKQILTGIMDIAIKKAMGDSMKTVIDSATSGLQSEFASLFGSSAPSGGTGLTGSNTPASGAMTQAGDYGMSSAASGVSGAASNAASTASQTAATTSATTALTGLTTSVTPLVTGFESLLTTAITPLTTAAQACATALNSAATSAGGSSAGGIGSAGAGMMGGASSAGAASDADMFASAFANGGIMTNEGPLSLRKYANGGIANSPQVAIYGEAGPEAYVPLPDGRTIPVTINTSGGSSSESASAAPAITVNVINQSGTQVAAQQQGQPTINAGQTILNVVLTAVTQPGSFRTGMQNALSSSSSSSSKPA